VLKSFRFTLIRYEKGVGVASSYVTLIGATAATIKVSISNSTALIPVTLYGMILN